MDIKYTAKSYTNFTSHTAMGINISNWFRLLVKNKFAIHPGFLPKALFLTGNVVLNAPFQLYEHLKYSKKIKKTKVHQPIFILGHHRSGTTYLHHVLSKDPDFAYCTTYEALIPYLFLTGGNIFKNILDKAMPETRPQDNVKIGASLPTEEEFAMASLSQTSFIHGFYFPKRIFKTFDESVVFEKGNKKKHWQERMDFLIKKLSFKNTGKRIILKSPANTGRLKEIYELYPDAKFIHIHRNPYDVYLSNENLYEKVLPMLSFQHVGNKHMEDFIIYSYEKMYRKYLKDKEEIPQGNIFEMSYDDFVNAPLDQLEKAYDHLNLGDFQKAVPHLNEHVQNEKGYKKNRYAQLDPATKEKINKKWGFFFEKYGYSFEKLKNQN